MEAKNFDNINHLVINFYPDGYTVAVKLNEFPFFTSETICETAKISYEETGLIDYVENGELPPILVEIIDKSPKLGQYKIWYDGCLVVELRSLLYCPDSLDFSQSSSCRQLSSPTTLASFVSDNIDDILCVDNVDRISRKETNIKLELTSEDMDCHQSVKNVTNFADQNDSLFVLLKPSNLSMFNDVLNLTETNCLSSEDRLQLESQIVLLNSAPLSLELEQSQPITFQLSKNKTCKKITRCPKLKDVIDKGNNKCSSENLCDMLGIKIDLIHKTTFYNMPLYLPSELTLQHYLATKRKLKSRTSSTVVQSRFERYKRIKKTHF